MDVQKLLGTVTGSKQDGSKSSSSSAQASKAPAGTASFFTTTKPTQHNTTDDLGDIPGYDDFLHGSTVSSCHKSIRLGFMRKVYGILSAQLALTFLVGAIMMSSESISSFVQNSPMLLNITYFVTLGLLVGLMAMRHQTPANFYLLFAFTLGESLMVGTIVTFYDVQAVLYAVVLTASVTTGLTIFAFQTKRDFTPWLGTLVSVLWIMFFASILQAFFPLSDTNQFLFCVAGAVLFSVFIIVDTQMIMNKLSSDEYILAAINLYLDIINLFLYILRTMNKK
eukprot:m.29684 g.29684  ORF g.29684 m.29684 type:complete len:281 (-) comp9227_c0_seq1:218-1060(-)